MRHILAGTMLALFVLLEMGCATMSVGARLEPGVEFARYRFYEWGPADALATGDPRLDNNPFFHDYLQGRIEKELARRGLARATSGIEPDLLLHYHASVSQKILIDDVDRTCYQNCRPGIIEYDQGSIVIDFVDAKRSAVIWRGWAQPNMQGAIDNQNLMEEQLDQAVTKMMAELPGRL